MANDMTRSARFKGAVPYFDQTTLLKVGFATNLVLFLIKYSYYWQIFSIFGGYWAFLEARFLEEVGDEKPTPFLYKPGLFEAKRQSFRAELC
jgi:hypothetical protein